MRFLLDANVNDEVGDVLIARSFVVDYVNNSFLPKTPDGEIDTVARIEGWILISHDKKFLRKIQQPRFGFTDSASTGYGRIMLMTKESLQVRRIEQSMDIIEMIHTIAVATHRRLLLTVSDYFIQYNDEPVPRTPRAPKQEPSSSS